jgi:hypothetical protein
MAAQSSVGNEHIQRLVARAKLKTWDPGDQLSDPVKYDPKKDEYVAKWQLGVPTAEKAVTATDEELTEMAMVLDFALESDAKATKVKATYRAVQLEHHFLDMINLLHKEVKSSKLALADRKAELKKAESELAAAKKLQETATTEQDKKDADSAVTNATEMVEMQKIFVAAIEANIAGLQTRIATGIANVKLHEKTHLDLAAEAASLTNAELKGVKEKAIRDKIVDNAIRIEGEVQSRMDQLLNPSQLGTEEQTNELQSWITDRDTKPADKQGEQDYHSMLRDKFAAAKAAGWP